MAIELSPRCDARHILVKEIIALLPYSMYVLNRGGFCVT